jgi:hypothetical protein
VSAQAMAEISPTSLSTGHGDNACLFLNLIADIAVQKYCKKKVMVYPSDVIESDTGTSETNAVDEEDNTVEVC